MATNIFLNNEWQRKHIKKIKELAGNRYTPELNIDVPVADIFDGVSRNERFYNSIRQHYGKLKRAFTVVSSKYENIDAQKLFNNLNLEISEIYKILDTLKEYNVEKITWDQVYKHTKNANEMLWELTDLLRTEKDKVEEQKNEEMQSKPLPTSTLNSDMHYLYEVQKELRHFEELSISPKAKLSNVPFLLLTGKAGTGKTHLLCDILTAKYTSKKILPGILVFGEFFDVSDDSLTQIMNQLGLKASRDQFLQSLDNAGKQSGCRTILVIDALNETRQRNFWKRELVKLVEEIKKYPNLALIVSVRSGFEEEVITKKTKTAFIHEEHNGFEFREWEAVNKFFKEFQLPLPEIPLLMPEFQNPLFLLLFCRAFQNRAKKNKGKKTKQIFRGHEGATYIFESFVDSVSKKIAEHFSISNAAGKNIWDTVIEKFAEKMVDKNSDRVSEEEAITIVQNAYPLVDHTSFLQELERNLLIVKVPSYSIEKNDPEGFDFRFPFQKFSDHLIGRYLFKKYEAEFGKENKNLHTAKMFFSKRRKLGKFLADPWNRGIIEALSIQCPEHLKGCELIDVAPYLKNSYIAKEAFIESLIWRKPKAFSPDQKNTLAYINREVIRTELGHNNFLNALLTIAPISNHPFKADFLHKHLSSFSMPERDSWWSTFLHKQYGERGAVDRLLEWGWSNQDKAHINDEGIRLCAVALCWFLTTPNRFVRDKATKALIALLTNRLSVVLELLKQFQDVNDLYVIERLYAVAYGCAIRSKNDKDNLKFLSQWVYDEIFKYGEPPVHILVRDYARGIVEIAIHEKINIAIKPKMIKPPFSSDWPNKIPSEKSLKNKYYPEDFFQKKTENRGFLQVWSSVMYNFGTHGDFGNYIINSAVNHWTGRRLHSKDISREKLFNNFKENLTKLQQELLEQATNVLIGINISDKSSFIELVLQREKDEEILKQQSQRKRNASKAYREFRNSLTAEKRKYFDKEIRPFLDTYGGINDPLERFDTGLAQRWIFYRVVQLGWDQKLHGQFDRYVNYHRADRSEHKPERIGKKYQWIALHELLARIADNFEFQEETQSDNSGRYEGTWQLDIRDIDPSCTLREPQDDKQEEMLIFRSSEILEQYNVWDKKISHLDWIKKNDDLPRAQQIIEIYDEHNNCWVALEGYVEWQENTPPEQDKYSLPTRRLWYMLKSYLVPHKDKNKIFLWAKKQNFYGRWMPESHVFYNVYLGEYPWSSAFLYLNTPYYNHDGWVDKARNTMLPTKILVTDDQYLNSGSSEDCSINESINIKLPAKLIVDEMKLQQNFVDGRFFDSSGSLVAFDPSVIDDSMPQILLVRKDRLITFLKSNEYALFWTLLGEKNVIGGREIEEPLGLLEISGAYTFNSQNKVIGARKCCFK